MMESRYVLKISNKVLYQEVRVPDDAEVFRIGFDISCDEYL